MAKKPTLVAVLLVWAVSAQATILTFTTGEPNRISMPDEYGDNANSASVTMGEGQDANTWEYARGNGWTPNEKG